MIADALRDVLKVDATLLAALSTYDFGDGAEIAIFTVYPFPENVTYPAVAITLGGRNEWGTRGKRGWVQNVDVQVFRDREYSSEDLRDIAERIKVVLDRSSPSLAGHQELGTHVVGPPTETTDERGFPGYRLDVTVRYLEE